MKLDPQCGFACAPCARAGNRWLPPSRVHPGCTGWSCARGSRKGAGQAPLHRLHRINPNVGLTRKGSGQVYAVTLIPYDRMALDVGNILHIPDQATRLRQIKQAAA